MSGPLHCARESDPDLAVYDTVSVKGIDPVVQLGTLEELLTGRPYDDIVADARSGQSLASRDGGDCVVLTIPDSLTYALALADDERLAQVARPWSETEEFWSEPDPEMLTEVLRDLAGLAKRARGDGRRLYSWVCV